jgi:hypothetical protein
MSTRNLGAMAGLAAVVLAAACTGPRPAGAGGAPGTGGAASTSPTTSAGGGATSSPASTTTATTTTTGAGGCPGDSRVFGVCTGPDALPSGPGKPGDPCQKETDCAIACCPCPHGQIHYAYLACTCGRCASICNPVNDTIAGVCKDAGGDDEGAGGADGGPCLRCSQILNIVLVEGDPDAEGPRACPGTASAAWGALSGCAAASCGSVCPGIMPTNACVACFEKPDSVGGCADELAACQAQ